MSTTLEAFSNDPVGQQIGKSKYVVGKYITGGSFGRIYMGRNIENNTSVAVKMEKNNVDKPQLPLEYGFYKQLGTYRGLPNILFFGPCGEWNALVMDMLGPSLQKMAERCGGTFSLRTTVQLMIQMIKLMEFFHGRGLIYRDTKPENFLLGQPLSNKWCTVNVIDLGLCKFWKEEDGSHIVYQEGKMMTGTVRYMSINNHCGREQSRRDDMEAIGYMIIYLHRGKLPWQGINADSIYERYCKIAQCKMNTEMEELCSNMPDQFAKYMKEVKAYTFEQEPNYGRLHRSFVDFLENNYGLEVEDKVYDWTRYHTVKEPHLRIM